MAKRTWKLRALPMDVDEVIRTAPSAQAAAKVLGVHRSTAFRLRQRQRSKVKEAESPATTPRVPVEGQNWAAWARQTFQLSPGEDALVAIGDAMQAKAVDASLPIQDRATAARTFMAIKKALKLEEIIDAQTTQRRASGQR